MRSAAPASPVSVADIPTSGGEPWFAELYLRYTGQGGLILPAAAGELLAVLEVSAEAVGRAGGPQHIRTMIEPTRRKLQRGAWIKGYREGWAVEVDIVRGRRRKLWTGGLSA